MGGGNGVSTSSVKKEVSRAMLTAANNEDTLNGQSAVTDSHDYLVEETSNCEDCCQSDTGSQSTTSVPLAAEEPQLVAGSRTPPQQDANQILANVAKPSENDFHPWFWEPSQGRMMTV